MDKTNTAEPVRGRLDVNWDSYWKGFIAIPGIEPLRSWLIKRACERLLKDFSVQGDAKFCELGAGTGYVSRFFGDKYHADIVVVDNNSEALKLSKKTFEGYPKEFKQIESDVFNLAEHNPGKFDLVHSGGLIEHFVKEARDEIIRVHCDLVKENGYILLFVPVHNVWYRFLNEGIFKFLHLLDEIPEVPWSLEELEQNFSKQGFKIINKTNVITEIGILAKRI